jgi:hypothetical protein
VERNYIGKLATTKNATKRIQNVLVLSAMFPGERFK